MSIASKSFRIIWRIIKIAATLLVAGVCIFMLWRVLFSRNIPNELDKMSVNEGVYAVYADNGDIEYFRQDRLTMTSDGYFGAPDCIFIPEANQIQLVVRYNNSTIRALAEKYAISPVPDRTAELFDMTLVIQTDATPENKDDNAGNVEGTVNYLRCKAVASEADERNLYNFRRLTFDLGECGIDLNEVIENQTLLAIYADFYYVEDINYDERPYSTIFLYDYKRECKWDDLSSSEKKDFKAYGESK